MVILAFVACSRVNFTFTFTYPFGAGIIFFNCSTPVYKMRIIQEPNMLEL